MKKRLFCIAYVALTLALLIFLLFIAQNILMPKYSATHIPDGALTSEYYAESPVRHDVIFIGDCEVYESFVPAKLWEEYGISSYVRGNAQQLAWHSYYLLEETVPLLMQSHDLHCSGEQESLPETPLLTTSSLSPAVWFCP